MPSVAQTSFVGGEQAPSLNARTDLAKYKTATRTMRNFFPHPHGGASNRGGTQFVCEVKDSSKEVRLVAFQFSTVQSYVLEFGDLYMRVITDGGRVVESPGAGTDIVKAGTYQWTASASGTNEYYCEANGGGDPSLSDPLYVFEDVGGVDKVLTEGTLGSLTAGQYAYGDNDTLGYSTIYVRLTDDADPDTKADGFLEASYIFELTTTYAEADLSLLKFVQSADVLYVTHPDYAPRKISRTAHDIWTITTISFGPSISAPTGLANSGSGIDYVVTAINSDGEESVASSSIDGAAGSATTWTAVTGADYYNVYKDTNASGTFGWIGQADTNSFTEPAAGIDADFEKTPPQANDPFSGASDYPGCATFFEQRLVFARTDNDPQKIWGSVVGNFENMNKSSPLRDDDSYAFTINARQVNEIRHLVPMNELIIGTSGAEWKMTPASNSSTITPTSVNVKVQSQWGMSHVPPLVIGNSVLFVEASGQKVRDLLYSLEADGYTGNDLSILSNHLFTNYQITEWAYQQAPDSIIWCVRNDGTLLGLTYYKEHDVWGWHRHDTEGDFESVACITTSNNRDDLYAVVNRTINGTTKRYIERFMPRLPANDSYELDIQDAYFVDCGLSLDSPITITGITQADPGVITATSHGLSDGDYVDVSEIVGMTELNGNRYVVANSTTHTFTLQTEAGADVDTSSYTAYTSGGYVRKAVTSITGLSHLEGETVTILANGAPVNNKTVSSGSITLDTRASRVHIGLGYTCDLETLDLEYQTETGTAQDKTRNISSAVLRLENTRALWIGPSSDRLVRHTFRTNEEYGDPTRMFTGDRELMIDPGAAREGRIFIRNSAPLPITVLAIIARMDHGES